MKINVGAQNTFWLYQHGVRNAYFQSYSHLKQQILIWVTLYLIFLKYLCFLTRCLLPTEKVVYFIILVKKKKYFSYHIASVNALANWANSLQASTTSITRQQLKLAIRIILAVLIALFSYLVSTLYFEMGIFLVSSRLDLGSFHTSDRSNNL